MSEPPSGTWGEWMLLLGFMVVSVYGEKRALSRWGPVRPMVHVFYWLLVSVFFALMVGVLEDADHGRVTGRSRQSAWLNGFLLEYTLSIDNLFIFHLIFREYKTPADQIDTALVWGIGLACAFRFLFFLIGTELFEWMVWLRFLFGILLLFTAYKTIVGLIGKANHHLGESMSTRILQFMQSHAPFVKKYDVNGKFLQFENSTDLLDVGEAVKRRASDPIDESLEDGHEDGENAGSLRLTMLALVVTVIGIVDAVFAVDAVAAKMSQTEDLFINFSSSLFAMMSFRWLFGVVEKMASMFELLKFGIAIILGYVGVELILAYWVTIPNSVSGIVICGVVGGSVIASIAWNGFKMMTADASLDPEIELTDLNASFSD